MFLAMFELFFFFSFFKLDLGRLYKVCASNRSMCDRGGYSLTRKLAFKLYFIYRYIHQNKIKGMEETYSKYIRCVLHNITHIHIYVKHGFHAYIYTHCPGGFRQV